MASDRVGFPCAAGGEGGHAGRPSYAMLTSRSYHPGIVMGGLLDRSVRSFADTIELAAWGGLATRAGGEIPR